MTPQSVVEVRIDGASFKPRQGGVVSAQEIRVGWTDGVNEMDFPTGETRYAFVVPQADGSSWVIPIDAVSGLLVKGPVAQQLPALEEVEA